jgi:hypothetical protein
VQSETTLAPLILVTLNVVCPETYFHHSNQTRALVVTQEAARRNLADVDTAEGSASEKKQEIISVERTDSASHYSKDFTCMVPEPFSYDEVKRGIFDVQTWVTGVVYWGLCMSLYSYSLFL